MASIPSPELRKKRPRWLLLAIVASLVFGAGCWTNGCSHLAFYRGERTADSVATSHLRDEAARAKVDALYERFGTVADEQRAVALPFAAATFVLGAALLALAARGLGGRTNTRKALMQVVFAQAIVVLFSFFLTRRMNDAELAWDVELKLAQQHETVPADPREAAAIDAFRRFGPMTWILFRTIASGLVIFALTRQRSREYFEAASSRVVER